MYLKGIDVSLIVYDIFNPSRTPQSFERNLAILSKEYTKTNLAFNREKSDVDLSYKQSIEDYNSRIGRHPWSAILIQ